MLPGVPQDRLDRGKAAIITAKLWPVDKAIAKAVFK